MSFAEEAFQTYDGDVEDLADMHPALAAYYELIELYGLATKLVPMRYKDDPAQPFFIPGFMYVGDLLEVATSRFARDNS